MRYKPKSVAALDITLGSLSNRMRVEVDPDIAVSAKTVGELRKLTAWPENLAIITPHESQLKRVVKVSRANVATRMSPKQ
jgi:hypothetical protein